MNDSHAPARETSRRPFAVLAGAAFLACSRFAAVEPAAEGVDLSDGAASTSDGGSDGPSSAPACRDKPFRAPELVTIAGFPEVRAYRPWLRGQTAVGVGTGPMVFAVLTDPSGAPQDVISKDYAAAAGFAASNHPMVASDGLALFVQGRTATENFPRIRMLARNTLAEAFGAPVDVGVLPGVATIEPWVLDDGLTLYFGAVVNGSDEDLYMTTRQDPQSPWSTANALTVLNRSPADGFPVVTADQLVIYFASANDRKSGTDDDIWMSTRATATDDWGRPSAIASLSSIADDRPTWISSDGCTMYLTSSRNGSSYALFRAVRD